MTHDDGIVHGLFVTQPLTLADLPRLLTLIIETLCRVIAAKAGRNWSLTPIVVRTWAYLKRKAARFATLVSRVEAGERPRSPPKPRLDRPRRPNTPRLPTGFAWLVRLVPEAAPCGGQLRHLLTDPQFAALLATAPRVARIFRPLCRMLGVLPDPDLPAVLFQPPAPTPAPKPSVSFPRPRESPGNAPSPDFGRALGRRFFERPT